MLMFAMWFTVRDSGSSAHRLVRAVGISLVAVVAVEIVQPMVGRTGSFSDLFHGLAGVLLVTLVIGLRGRIKAGLFLWIAALAVVFLVGWITVPASRVVLDMRAFDEQFPMLGDFETAHEMRWWQASNGGGGEETTVSRTAEHAAVGAHALRIVTGKGTWAGVKLPVPVADWQGYETLSFRLFNPGEPFDLHLRLDDTRDGRGYYERYSAVTGIAHGDNRAEIELNEQRNPRFRFGAVVRLLLFTGRRQPSRVLYLDQVRLR